MKQATKKVKKQKVKKLSSIDRKKIKGGAVKSTTNIVTGIASTCAYVCDASKKR